eukprot:gnl/MRDRNA2_/MRDRNA2_180868_c0_seq1.p1 gnl/MRDRNA2_/MRDRNA2_180868_c0~~gnl/MRDRNA2_/MRDRNA2_180868_c0_seq1.p1  ORF type:complete len:147 (+),score=23.85 gnl/MRDRNA2_/MRDRNA2_180868_c0_seq1:280-720(+)
MSYSAVVSAFGKGKHWELAMHLLEECKMSAGADRVTYGAAICACEKCAEWQCALALLGIMWPGRLQPHVITYSSAISACEKGKEWSFALQLLEECKVRRAFDIFSYSATISACEKGCPADVLHPIDNVFVLRFHPVTQKESTESML